MGEYVCARVLMVRTRIVGYWDAQRDIPLRRGPRGLPPPPHKGIRWLWCVSSAPPAPPPDLPLTLFVFVFVLFFSPPTPPSSDLVRTRDPAKLGTCDIVVDVGGVYDAAARRFDHHQRGFAEVFGHGFSTKLSSAGLVYKCVRFFVYLISHGHALMSGLDRADTSAKRLLQTGCPPPSRIRRS